MKGRPFILRCAALVLILIFLQKTGVGLFVHNLLHATPYSSEYPASSDEKGKEISFACSCIDDFLAPFTEADQPVVSPLIISYEIPSSFFHITIPFRAAYFPSLRGPPAVIA